MAIDIHLRGSDVVVALTGLDRIFALKRRLAIPKDRITGVDVTKRKDLESEARPSWLRMPGAQRDHAAERDQHSRVDLFQMLLDRNIQQAGT